MISLNWAYARESGHLHEQIVFILKFICFSLVMAPLSYSSTLNKKNEKKFYKLLAELVDTERTYVADLEGVNNT